MAARTRQPVRLQRGQFVEVHAGRGVVLVVERYDSGAVELRNANTGAVLRQWSPKEAKSG